MYATNELRKEVTLKPLASNFRQDNQSEERSPGFSRLTSLSTDSSTLAKLGASVRSLKSFIVKLERLGRTFVALGFEGPGAVSKMSDQVFCF